LEFCETNFRILLPQIINSLKVVCFIIEVFVLLSVQEKEKDHEYWPTVDVHDHIGKSRPNAPADEEASFKL
jgi:hypothetical protein